MIGIVKQNKQSEALNLVSMALIRSTSRNLVSIIDEKNIGQKYISVYVLIDPSDTLLSSLLSVENIKIVIFGKLPKSFIDTRFQCQIDRELPINWERSSPTESYHFSESDGYVEYTPMAEHLFNFAINRPLERFDFTDEWNNLGYGRIRHDGSIWSISHMITLLPQYQLANINVGEDTVASYSGLFDERNISICWFNRSVGPLDSPEWHLIEKFISSYRSDNLPSIPVLLEVPQGYDAAITMRLDCDEDIESCRHLWNVYREIEVPFSIAIHTTNLADAKHHSIVKEMHNKGVSILSHTATHAPNWGGSYDSAMFEAVESCEKIKLLINENVKYAVSPFHQAPPYALKALSDAGYKGCVGGIIRNDPEFLMHSGGNLDGLSQSFIGHSQQVMLHGDCVLSSNDPLSIYKESFKLSKDTFTIFGYLDHPFSDRYSYGWETEKQRALVHLELIKYIRSSTDNVLFLSENDALDFIYDKSFIRVDIVDQQLTLSYYNGYVPTLSYVPKVLYKNNIIDNLEICIIR
jgi:hypothetical protein